MHNITLERSIELLRKILDAHQGELDTGVISELKAVVATLEEERDNSEHKGISNEAAARTLNVLADVIRLVTNISDWLC